MFVYDHLLKVVGLGDTEVTGGPPEVVFDLLVVAGDVICPKISHTAY